jgi:hypothetical protein
MLDGASLGAYIEANYRRPGDRLFRMERLPRYADNAAQTARWLAGAAEPDWAAKQPWLDYLADNQRRGLIAQRVRAFGLVLTDDELAACAFGYAYNGRYEDIRVLHGGEHAIPAGLIPEDYWLIEPADGPVSALRMDYDAVGVFRGAELVAADAVVAYMADRDRALAAAEPFATWWARHLELPRRHAA